MLSIIAACSDIGEPDAAWSAVAVIHTVSATEGGTDDHSVVALFRAWRVVDTGGAAGLAATT
jgi:hypothetical protein